MKLAAPPSRAAVRAMRAAGFLALIASAAAAPLAAGVCEPDSVISISDAEPVLEGHSGTVFAVFDVSITPPDFCTTDVNFETADGAATEADNDYVGVFGLLTFVEGGSDTLPVEIVVNGDLAVEVDEDFFVNLSLGPGDGSTIGDGQGRGVILNDDASVSVDDVSVTEGDAGTVNAVFTVSIAGNLLATASVFFETNDGTATVADNDYEAASDVLIFPPGNPPPPQTFPIVVNGDLINEPDEMFQFDLTDVQGATVADAQGLGTILNDDDLPLISIDDVEVSEGDAGTNSAVFTVAISGALSQPVSVRVATHNLTAEVADGDYEEASADLVFTPGGPTTMSVGVTVNGDTNVEPNEQFRLDLLNPMGAVLDDHHGLATILNDDQRQQPSPNSVRLLPAPPVGEGESVATVTVERAGTGGAAQVTVRFRRGTASAGQDFVAGQQTVSWGPGESGARTAAVELLDDHRQEDDETIEVVLTAPVGTTLGDPSEIELVLVDDDEPTGLVQLGEPVVVTVINSVAELAVQVLGPQGDPVARASVTWQVSGGGELLLGESTLTNGQGVARQEVQVGTQPGIVTVEATLEATGESVSFRLTAQGDLAALFDAAVNPGEASVAGALDAACVAPVGDFATLCSYVFGLGDDDQRAVVREATPLETSAQGTLSLDVGTSQLRSVGARLAALRGGATRAVTEQIAFVFEDRALALQELRYAVARFHDEEAWASERVAHALQTAESAPQEEPPAADVPPGEAVNRVSRLGFFLSGRVAFGDRQRTRLEEGFEADLAALTAGLDYRFGDRFLLGGALGYLDTAIDLDADGGGLDAASYSLTGYWSYFREAFYLEGALGYGRNAFDIERHIDLPVPFGGQPRLTAVAEPDGDQLAASLGLGHDVAFGAASLEGFARASWVDAAIDGYVERGAGPFNLAIRDQDLESLLSEVGVAWSYAASRAWGILQPTLRAAYLHEFEDESRLIRGSFAGDVQANEFLVPTEEPDRDFFNASAGFVATTVRGRSFFLNYDTDLARDDLDLGALSLGLRLEL